MNIILICARGNSKGIRNKNIKLFNNKPLISWTIKQAKKLKSFDKIIVSTDSNIIAKIAIKFGAEAPFKRPKKLSLDNSLEWNAWKHAIKFLEKKYKKKVKRVLSLPAVSPNRKITDVQKCISLYNKGKFDSVMCVTHSQRNPYYNMVSRKINSQINIVIGKKKFNSRQESPKVYDLTTVATITSGDFILKNDSIFRGNIGSVLVDKPNAIDIDTIEDFKYAEYLFKKNEKKRLI